MKLYVFTPDGRQDIEGTFNIDTNGVLKCIPDDPTYPVAVYSPGYWQWLNHNQDEMTERAEIRAENRQRLGGHS